MFWVLSTSSKAVSQIIMAAIIQGEGGRFWWRLWLPRVTDQTGKKWKRVA